MNTRQYLKNKITLYGESDGKKFERTFTISKVISTGADGICYEASHDKSSKGVLKEFYPLRLPGFERTEDGHLVYSTEYGGSYRKFLRTKEDFIEPYEMLLELKRNDDNDDLATFIPAFELYYGPGNEEHEEGTVYVWTPDRELITFSKICDEIHKHPDVRPEYKLFIALKSIETLTKCICSLHAAGIIHRDIKPSNFGFRRRGNEMLTQSISMFDVDSLCSVMSKNREERGTIGYCEMSFGREAANNQTDIYSIGATLFTAIIITKETISSGYKYNQNFFDNIGDMVRESELIKASERNSDYRLRNILSTILRKCLCERAKRYERCEDLLEDIEKALFYTLPPEISKSNRMGEKWVLSQAEKKLDANKEKNSSLVMLYHLFEHPLYRCVGEEEDTLNIVVNGLGLYGQKFLDLCLQMGQIPSLDLNVIVIVENDTERELYLEERPELKDFFDIEVPSRNIFYRCPESYGRIEFITVERRRFDDVEYFEILQKLVKKLCRNKHLHYIFTDLNDDKLNFKCASAYADILNDAGRNGHISYASEENEDAKGRKARKKNVYPVYINSEVKKTELYPQIERMAFNVHLVWEKNLNLDFSDIRKDFRRPYNHYSCVSYVVSLKHKMFSIGVDMDQLSYEEAAQLFSSIKDRADATMIRNGLIWSEHRRWVAEKLCNGWGRLTDPDRIEAGVTKDERTKKHICIVRSRPDQPLDDESWMKNSKEKWDTASEKEISSLDDLDRLSVNLHRIYTAKAKDVRRRGLNTVTSLAEIRFLVGTASVQQDTGIRSVFAEWYECIRSIWSGDQSKVRMYKSLRNAFVSSVEKLDEKTSMVIMNEVKEFDEFFHPVLASKQFTDWKKNDTALIDNIPFILTYTDKTTLVIPFTAGKTADELFRNVAAATIVNPEKILYLYTVRKEHDLDLLEKIYPRVARYLQGKNMKASEEFIVIHDRWTVSERQVSEVIKRAGGELRKSVQDDMTDDQEWISQLRKYLKDAGRNKSSFMLERNDTPLSDVLAENRFYDEFAWYSMEPGCNVIKTQSGCDALCYINKSPFITVSDMMILAGTEPDGIERPEFEEEHEELWQRYCRNPSLWNRFCAELNQITDENDILAVFDADSAGTKKKAREYRYILPGFCIHGAMKVVAGLKACKLIEKDSAVTGYASDSCEVTIYDRYSQKETYDRLFSNIYALISADAVRVIKGEQIKVICDSLTVRGKDKALKRRTLVRYFKDKGFLMDNPEKDGILVFGSFQIKRLLTDPQRIIGLQIYHEARSLGIFDDVVCKRPAKSGDPYLCIVTRGMRSYYISYCNNEEDSSALISDLKKETKKNGIDARVMLLTGTDFGKQIAEIC